MSDIYPYLILHTDGGARGNPGPAGIGVVISVSAPALARPGARIAHTNILETISRYIGEATNNHAEYQALIAGLTRAKELGAQEIDVYMDSELIVKQMKREYKVKNKGLASLFVKVWNLSQSFKKVTFTHIPREQNESADKLVNEAIDNEAHE